MAPAEIPASARVGSLLFGAFGTGLGRVDIPILSMVVTLLKVRMETDTDVSVRISAEVPLVTTVEDALEEGIVVCPGN